MKNVRFGYGCTLRGGVCIVNRQRAASNVHTTRTHFIVFLSISLC